MNTNLRDVKVKKEYILESMKCGLSEFNILLLAKYPHAIDNLGFIPAGMCL